SSDVCSSDLDQPPLQEDEIRSQRLNELESSNAMWGWIAGAVVLALVLMFVFTRGQVRDTPTISVVETKPAETPAQVCLPSDEGGNVLVFDCGPRAAATALGKYLQENPGHRVRS